MIVSPLDGLAFCCVEGMMAEGETGRRGETLEEFAALHGRHSDRSMNW
jgi:hypothetical protein